jgi:hypothetical protein
MPKNAVIFECVNCDFRCCKKSNYDKHILTLKHKMLTNVDTENAEKTPHWFPCHCGKEYKHRQSLSVHKKSCQKKEPSTIEFSEKLESLESSEKMETSEKSEKEIDLTDKDIIKMLIKDNSELKTMMLEVVKSIQPNTMNINNNTTNNNTTNNNSNHFNLQIYLNETCKDAINITDFVNSLQVKLKDLEDTARLGYSEGVSKIFINGLNELEVNKRPIHCSDAKRETLYIKNKNEWTKDADKTLLTSAIKTIGKKNIQQIFEWQKKYPEYNDPSSRQNDKYLKMLCNAMNGSTDDEQEKNMDKIIRNITKEVIIDKNIVF